MLDPKLKVKTHNFKNFIFATGILSGLLILCASYGDFQRINIYEKPTDENEFGNFKKYAIVKEYEHVHENVKKLKIVARVTINLSINKIIYSFAGLLTASACLAWTYQQERDQPFSEYVEIKQDEIHKANVDTEVAAYMQMSEELVQIRVSDMHDELMENKVYRDMLADRNKTRAGDIDEGEEKKEQPDESEVLAEYEKIYGNKNGEKSSDNVSESKKSVEKNKKEKPKEVDILNDKQMGNIFNLNRREQVPLPQAITSVTGFKPGEPEYEKVRNEMIKRLTS